MKIENDTIVVLEGRNVTLYSFSSGSPSPNVSWLDNAVKEGSILKLLNIGRHRNGSYICLATNACGSDWGKVDINVQCEFMSTLKYLVQMWNCRFET